MIDQPNQNLLVAIVLIVASAIGIAWRVLHALYVKPGDFKIMTMQGDVAELRDELLRLRKTPENMEAFSQVGQPVIPPSAAATKIHLVKADASSTVVSNAIVLSPLATAGCKTS